MTVIEKLRELLKLKNITQNELSNLMNVTQTTINNYLTNRTKLDVDTLIKISTILQISPSYFFDDSASGAGVGPTSTVQKNLVGNNNVVQNSNLNFGATEMNLRKEIEHLKEKIESLNSQLAKCEENNEFFKSLIKKD